MRALNLAYTDALLAAIRAMTASLTTLQTLARKGYAQHLVVGSVDTTSREEEQGIVLNEPGAPLTSSVTAHLFTDAVVQRTSCRHGQVKDPYACVGCAAS